MKIVLINLQIIILILFVILFFPSEVYSQSLDTFDQSHLQKALTILTDTDGDGVADASDNCPITFNPMSFPEIG